LLIVRYKKTIKKNIIYLALIFVPISTSIRDKCADKTVGENTKVPLAN